jgi:hypothetical protein
LVTVIVPVVFFELIEIVPGLTVTVQVTPSCVTVKACPPMVRAAVRDAAAVLAATLKATVPGPLPLPPEVADSQLALVVVVQVQPAGAVTVIEPVLAAAVVGRVVAEMVVVHGTPACVTVTT